MADSLKADLVLEIFGSLANAIGNVNTSYPFAIQKNERVTDGTVAGKADKVWILEDYALAQNATLTIDVDNFTGISVGPGNGLDALGNAIDFAEITCICVINKSTDGGILLIGGEGSTAAWNPIFNDVDTSLIKLLPGGVFLVWCSDADPAYPVADTSNHLLEITENNTGDAIFTLILIGRSA